MWLYCIGAIVTVVICLKLFFSQKKQFWSKYGIRTIDLSKVIHSWHLFTGKKALFHVDDYTIMK